jgi:drug/metabolite transporter (DMT)-like permease
MSKITFYRYRNNYLNWLVYSIYFYFIIYNLQFDSKFYESVEVGYANLINYSGVVILVFLSMYFIFREKFKYSNVIVVLSNFFFTVKELALSGYVDIIRIYIYL